MADTERKLREVLRDLPAGQTFSTAQIVEMVGGDNPRETSRDVYKLGKTLGLAARGPEQPGKGYQHGKMVRPLVWRRPETAAVEPAHNAARQQPCEGVSLRDLQRQIAELRDRVRALESLLEIKE